jgi:hypothetical protein
VIERLWALNDVGCFRRWQRHFLKGEFHEDDSIRHFAPVGFGRAADLTLQLWVGLFPSGIFGLLLVVFVLVARLRPTS